VKSHVGIWSYWRNFLVMQMTALKINQNVWIHDSHILADFQSGHPHH
jgi:hypothetical protein